MSVAQSAFRWALIIVSNAPLISQDNASKRD